jgi:hypothetical protein
LRREIEDELFVQGVKTLIWFISLKMT